MSDSGYMAGPPAGWYRDPFGQADGRYWNGTIWTDAVSRGGVTLKVPPDPSQATIPPVPGSELRAPVAATASAAPAPEPPRRSSAPIVLAVVLVGVIIAGIFWFLASDEDGDAPTSTSVAPPVTEVRPTTPSSTPSSPTSAPPVTEPVTPATTAG